MRTHPLVAVLVVATAITTVTVFGHSAPFAPVAPAKKPRHADVALARQTVSSAVPAWLVTPAASAAAAASPGPRASAGSRTAQAGRPGG